MGEAEEDNAPTYNEQVRQDILLLVRLSIRQGFMPSRDRLREAMSAEEWRGYLAGVAPTPAKGRTKEAIDPRLSNYLVLLAEADKLARRVDKTGKKRRQRISWQELRELTRNAYYQAFVEIRRVLKNSPELAVGLFPPFVDPPHVDLGPGRSDMPRLRKTPVAPEPAPDPRKPDEFTSLYIESLFEPDPLKDPTDQ